MANKRTFKGIDLLEKVLEFTEMTPDQNQWSLSALKSNPPRQIRLQQIESLLNAFLSIDVKTGLIDSAKSFFTGKQKSSVQLFLRGDFIKLRTISDYAETIEFIKDFMQSSKVNISETPEIRLHELVFIFPKLVNYKRYLGNVLTYNSSWLEASSIVSQFSIHLTNSISKNLVGKYNDLDKVLEMFINPKGLTFTEDELLSKFNYPAKNLRDVDMDFI